MTADSKTAERKAEANQAQGTREFDEAIAGKGPKMPPVEADREQDAELAKALEDTFPGSDPVAATSAETTAGAPEEKKSVDPKTGPDRA